MATTGTLHGHVADPSGALISGAQITVSLAQGGPIAKTTADAAGAYVVHGLAAGSYVIEADFTGFAQFVSTPIALAAGQTKGVDIKMAIESTQQQVVVTDEGGPQVSVDADSNASSIVLKDKDLDALSDDPDELSNELSALAGPSAGPNGGQIYIDGFTGGQLPPKSAIREIRINQNPFSAEFDHIGYGRIEILTKPGTDQLHGRFFVMGNDDAFNTGNPFTKIIPAYHTIQGNGTVSGALSKWASFFVSVEQRNIQDASVYTAETAVLDSGVYAQGVVSGSLFAPSTRTNVSPRIDLQLGQKNTLSLRYQFWRNNSSGSIGSIALPTQNSTSDTIEHTIQLNDSHIINDRMVNELRIEYRRSNSTQTPVSYAPTVSVPSYFTGGGSGSRSTQNADHFELQEYVTMSAGAHAIKFGAWLRDDRQATSSVSNFNGSFSFPSLDAYIATLNGMAQGLTVAQIAAACPPTGNCTPNTLTYTTGPEGFKGNLFNSALYIQDDWKKNRFLTLSGGLRWESQNHVADHSDWAPRVAFAYALDGHKDQKQAKTVLRGGFGFFYDRFGVSNLVNLEQYNGVNSQTQTVIQNPTCFDADSLDNIDGSDPSQLPKYCGAETTATPQTYTVTNHYRSPYAEQVGGSIERQILKRTTLTVTYLHSFGVHQMVTRNANPYAITGPDDYYSPTATLPDGSPVQRLDPSKGIVLQYFPEAVYKQNQVILNVNAQFTRNFSVSGFYNWTNANSNSNGSPSNSYNLNRDYGRATYIRPQSVFLFGNWNGPWGLSFNPMMNATAGRPYNLTVGGVDLTGDNFFNSRPAYASGACGASAGQSNDVSTGLGGNLGCLNNAPGPGADIIAPSLLRGPASFVFNLRVSRSIGFGPKIGSAAGGQGGPPPGGPGGGPRGGGRGGLGPGGLGGGPGGPRGGMPGTGHKYSLSFSAMASNLFNNINYATPSGAIIPTFVPTSGSTTGITGPGSRFGQSTSLAGGIFQSSSSAARRIFFQASLQF